MAVCPCLYMPNVMSMACILPIIQMSLEGNGGKIRNGIILWTLSGRMSFVALDLEDYSLLSSVCILFFFLHETCKSALLLHHSVHKISVPPVLHFGTQEQKRYGIFSEKLQLTIYFNMICSDYLLRSLKARRSQLWPSLNQV